MSDSRRLAVPLIVALAACGDEREQAPVKQDDASARAPAVDRANAAAGPMRPHVDDRAKAPCADPVLHVDDGVPQGWLCPAVAGGLGLTIVDVSEKWAPRPFAPGPDGVAPKFREQYLSLAAGVDPEGDELRAEDRLVELYGVTPAPSVVLRRMNEVKRHACHAAIDNSSFAKVTWTVKEAPNAQIDARDRKRRILGNVLERERKHRKLPDIAALAKLKTYKFEVERWQRLEAEHAAVKATQLHLVCEGLLKKKFVDGRMIWLTGDKLDLWQRGNFLIPHGELDAETREALAAGGLELDYRMALRVLRERVVDATGLIEDGSAGPGATLVVGRKLDPVAMYTPQGYAPMPDGAPDLIGAATDAAARELGWTSPEATRDWLTTHQGAQLQVAITLPPRPAYHSEHMELRAVIDRGDIWYDPRPRVRPIKRRPALTVYAKDGDREIALVRWPTTIGGWADEVMPGGWVKKVWKESDVGKRAWKELLVAPTWQPPDTTPDGDLMRNLWNGKWRLKREVFGPGPRSAYGMVMLIHHKPVKMFAGRKKGWVTYWGDRGIRSHGTSGVASVTRGTSHGCHRLFNHLAVRLGAFLIQHRNHVVRGDQKDNYLRMVRHAGDVYRVKIDTRGYLYELTPPVPVMVTKGRILSARKKPFPKR
jgi:hypothetical protein